MRSDPFLQCAVLGPPHAVSVETHSRRQGLGGAGIIRKTVCSTCGNREILAVRADTRRVDWACQRTQALKLC
jgi:hypothetical protein